MGAPDLRACPAHPTTLGARDREPGTYHLLCFSFKSWWFHRAISQEREKHYSGKKILSVVDTLSCETRYRGLCPMIVRQRPRINEHRPAIELDYRSAWTVRSDSCMISTVGLEPEGRLNESFAAVLEPSTAKVNMGISWQQSNCACIETCSMLSARSTYEIHCACTASRNLAIRKSL